MAGPAVGPDLRGAAWAEVMAACAVVSAAPMQPELARRTSRSPVPAGPGPSCSSPGRLTGPRSDVRAGEPLRAVTLRSYALGAAHEALGLVWSEGIAVDEGGQPVDLTIRSFAILAALDMPEVTVRVHPVDRWPVNGSDAVFVATWPRPMAGWPGSGLSGGRRGAPPCAHRSRRDTIAPWRSGRTRRPHERSRWSVLPGSPHR